MRTKLTKNEAFRVLAMIAKGTVSASNVQMFMNGERVSGADAVMRVLLAATMDSLRTNVDITSGAGPNFPSQSGVPTTGGAMRPGADAPRPQPTYGFDEPKVPTRLGNDWIVPTTDDGIASPADFNAPEPKDRPMGEGVDLTDAGETPIFKSRDGERYRVVKTETGEHTIKAGLFSDIIKMEATPEQWGQPTGGDTDTPLPLSRKRKA